MKPTNIDGSKIKALAGGEKRNTDSAITFNPTHKIVLHTGHAPVGISSECFRIEAHIALVNFPWKFSDDMGEAQNNKNIDIATI